MDGEKYTLLTGGTGLLGQFLLVELLRSRQPVAVVARPVRGRSPRDRIEVLLARFERNCQRRFPRPVVLSGDLTSDGLGLDRSEAAWVSRHCSRVLHSAANLSFRPAGEHPDNEPFRTNVEGTRHLIEFCQAAGIREFHHVSSAYVCGLRTGLIRETDGQLGQKFANDYEASKLLAEQLLHSSPEIERLTVYRPSIVIDPTPGSHRLGDRTIYLTFTIYQLSANRFGPPAPLALLRNVGLRGDDRKNIVPADWVARVVVQILRRPKLHGGTYHLTNPEGTPLCDLDQAFRDVLQQSNAVHRRSGSPENEAARIEAQFVETFTPYFRDDPIFDQSNLIDALRECGEKNCPAVGVAEIAALARQQVEFRPAKLLSQPESQDFAWKFPMDATGGPEHGWQAAEREGSHSEIGVILSGPGGGDWVLQLTSRGATIRHGGAEAMDVRVYASALTWNEILDGTTEFDTALAAGRFTCEFDSGAAADATREIREVVSRLAKPRLAHATREVVVDAQ